MKRLLTTCIVVALVLVLVNTAMADLIAYWPFDEDSGTTAYDSVGTNDGTVVGALWTTGVTGSALDFDGIDDIVVVGNDPYLHVTDLTIGMWIFPDLASYNWAKTLLGYGGVTNQHEYFMSIGQPGGGRKIGAYIGHHGPWLWSYTEVNQDEWSHVAAAFDSINDEVKIYINGQLVSIYSELGPILPTTDDLWIGNRADMSGYAFDGIIDDVRIYNQVLTAEEIAALVVPPTQVDIDIKPGSYPNAINLGSYGLIPVAILSSDEFDATTVDPETVELAGADVAVRGKSNKYMAHAEDVNGDGLVDLLVQVATENLAPDSLQDGFAVLTGNLLEEFGGTLIEGTDEITIVPPG
jgi:hypothetical protein